MLFSIPADIAIMRWKMNVKQWLNSENTIKKSKKGYAHFDYRTNIESCAQYITDPEKLSYDAFPVNFSNGR